MDRNITQAVQAYREETHRSPPDLRLHSPDQAIEFVNQRGFIFFWPIRGIPYPSLWTAVAGEVPVVSNHDHPGHVTWGWKDNLLGKKKWYYAKLLRNKATILSLNAAPHFYALKENYGAPEHDYLTQYEQGRMTMEAKNLYEVLLNEGPLDTVVLRRKANLSAKASSSKFERSLTHLQSDMKIMPVGVSRAGGWNYAFIYDLVTRHFPELPEIARQITEGQARRDLCSNYFRSVGAAQMKDVMKIFRWSSRLAKQVLDPLLESGMITRIWSEADESEWYILSELVDFH